jgi:hypothetical protein
VAPDLRAGASQAALVWHCPRPEVAGHPK